MANTNTNTNTRYRIGTAEDGVLEGNAGYISEVFDTLESAVDYASHHVTHSVFEVTPDTTLDYYITKETQVLDKDGDVIDHDEEDVADYTLESVNAQTDDLLDSVREAVAEYSGQRYAGQYAEYCVNDDCELGDEQYVKIRIANHRENVRNNDRHNTSDIVASISVVIAEYDPTETEFMESIMARKKNEHELRYDSTATVADVMAAIRQIVNKYKA